METRHSVWVTCGPASVPIDAVRRITNHATGEIGAVIGTMARQEGFDVVGFRGESSTFPASADSEWIPFSTNASLLTALQAQPKPPAAIFHAAALSDFQVAEVAGRDAGGKLKSRGGEVTLTLQPTAKILPVLRDLFPRSVLVGWKYEVEGTREDVVHLGRSQLAECRSEACVLNGPAYGRGFGLLTPDGVIQSVETKQELALILLRWLADRLSDFHAD